MGKSTALQSGHTSASEASPDPIGGTLQSSSTLPPASSPSLTPSLTPSDPKGVSASSLPEKRDTVFHDALEEIASNEPGSRPPTHTDRQVTPKSAAGAGITVAPDPPLPQEATGHLPVPPVSARGASIPAASANTPLVTPRLADWVRCSFPPQPPATDSVSRVPVKKAVVVGINYASLGMGQPLQYGVKDATRFAEALKGCGFSEDNTIVLIDEPNRGGQEHPTYLILIKWINWLVGDARAGDILVFFFSGHGTNRNEFTGLITADGAPFSRHLLEQCLVRPVPTGCRLHIMLDCCFASAMIQLQYCVGRMINPAELLSPSSSFVGPITVTASTPELVSPELNASTSPNLSLAQPLAPLKREAFGGSFHDFPTINGPGPPAASTLPGSGPFVPSNNAPPPRRSRGNAVVAAAPPLPSASTNNVAGTETGWTEYLASWVGMGLTPSNSFAAPPRASTGGEPQHVRQAVVEGTRLPDYFQERKEGFVKPAGNVVFWAGTGANQRSYEAHPKLRFWNGGKFRVRNGIVANAICTVLEARINQKLTVRDLWNCLVGALDEENCWRSERDATKTEQPDPKDRVQQAELWVSQPEPLSDAAPVLDRPML